MQGEMPTAVAGLSRLCKLLYSSELVIVQFVFSQVMRCAKRPKVQSEIAAITAAFSPFWGLKVLPPRSRTFHPIKLTTNCLSFYKICISFLFDATSRT